MERMSTTEATRTAYTEMSPWTYYIASILLYAVIVLLAMLLEDISSIFDFVSAYAISCIAFLIPSTFYRKGVQKFNIDAEDPQVKKNMRLAIFFIPLGCLNAILGITSAILTILGLNESGH